MRQDDKLTEAMPKQPKLWFDRLCGLTLFGALVATASHTPSDIKTRVSRSSESSGEV